MNIQTMEFCSVRQHYPLFTERDTIKFMYSPLNKMIGKRIKLFRDRLGLTQPELTQRCGWKVGGRLSNYELGQRKFKLEDLVILSKALEVPVECLISEKEPEEILAHRVPLIDWQIAMKGKEAVDSLERKSHRLLAVDNCSDKSFALRMKGNAMVSSLPDIKGFAEGEIIIADPLVKPEHGRKVIAALPTATEAICRQYLLEGGMPYLSPLNSRWGDTIPVTPHIKICGVVIGKVDYEI